MTCERSLWLPLIGPALALGAPVAAAAYAFTRDPLAAALVLIACLASAMFSGCVIARQRHHASTQLRRNELRGASPARTEIARAGIYDGLLREARQLMSEFESQAETALQAKAALEARAHVRRRETHRLIAALNCIDQPVLIIDVGNQLLFHNAAAGRLLQSAGAALDGANVRLSDLPQAEPICKLVEETQTRNGAADRRTAEFELPGENEPVAYQAATTNILDEREKLLGTVAVLTDIREERRERSQQAEFVSSVCHELKTPLASIKAFVEMLIDGDVADPNEQLELYGFIDGQVDRLTRLIENMLNLARIQSGVIKIQREDLELNDVLHKALDTVAPTAEEKQIRLVPELSELYLPVHLDPDLFGQAIINLLSNAVKYTPENGEVKLRCRMDGPRAVIEVRDNGMGIPADSLPHIFKRFYRVPENNKAASGTGLGLALVHYIVADVHQGVLEVESEVDAGSCFRVTLALGHRNHNTTPLSAGKKKPEPSSCRN